MGKRRDFIKKPVLGTSGLAIGGIGFGAKSYASIVGANDRINAASIGIGGRGSGHVKEICNLKTDRNVHLVTICDVDERLFAAQNKVVLERNGITPKNEWDMRRVFEDKDIDAVWHSKLLACIGDHMGLPGG